MITSSKVIVVGGGPAGIATAIAARRRGMRTTVLDAQAPPIDKPCGEGILPQGIAAARSLGISLPAESVFPFRGIQFSDEDSTARANFGSEIGLSVRRVRLHQILIDHAIEAGVEFRWGTRVTEIKMDSVTTAEGRLPYDWLIGADGKNSQIRKWAGLDTQTVLRKRFGFRRHYPVRPWSDAVEVHWAHGCQIFLTPTGREEVGVVVFSHDPGLRLERALPRFPGLAGKLRGATPTTREMGDTTCLRILPAVTKGRVALVGDASGTVDAVTGHGLSLSFQQALPLAEAMERGNLSHYELAHEQIAAVPITMTRLMLLMGENDWVRRRVLRLFQKTPSLFARLLAIHTETLPLSSLGMAEIAGMGWKFLWT